MRHRTAIGDNSNELHSYGGCLLALVLVAGVWGAALAVLLLLI